MSSRLADFIKPASVTRCEADADPRDALLLRIEPPRLQRFKPTDGSTIASTTEITTSKEQR